MSGFPPARRGVNLPAHRKHSRVVGIVSDDTLKFLVGFDRIAQHQPTFCGFKLKAFCLCQSVHATPHSLLPLNLLTSLIQNSVINVFATGELEPLIKPLRFLPFCVHSSCSHVTKLGSSAGCQY